MAKKPDSVKQIDMSNLTIQELAEIRNEVLRNLALRRFGEGAEPTPIGPYDKHSSVHTKNSTEPGRYSQRSTVFERNCLKLKSDGRLSVYGS